MRSVSSVVWFLAAVATCSAQGDTPVRDSVAGADLPTLRAALLSGDASPSGGRVAVPAEHRALFCRFDDALDRRRLPLRMRLGSLEEVNRKEGKPGWTAVPGGRE